MRCKIGDMELRTKVSTIGAMLLVGALVFLGATWWVNGKDDTWLYAMCGVIVISSFFYLKWPEKGANK